MPLQEAVRLPELDKQEPNIDNLSPFEARGIFTALTAAKDPNPRAIEAAQQVAWNAFGVAHEDMLPQDLSVITFKGAGGNTETMAEAATFGFALRVQGEVSAENRSIKEDPNALSLSDFLPDVQKALHETVIARDPDSYEAAAAQEIIRRRNLQFAPDLGDRALQPFLG